MHEELMTEDVENFVADTGRITVRMPVMGESDVIVDRAVGFIQNLENELREEDIDVIIFSRNALTHTRIEANGKDKKSALCEKMVYRLHLDYLAYSEVIVSVPRTKENEETIRKLSVRYAVDYNG